MVNSKSKISVDTKKSIIEELISQKQKQFDEFQAAQDEKLKSSNKQNTENENLVENPREQMMDEIDMRAGTLDQIREELVRLKNIPTTQEQDTVSAGALVKTNHGLIMVAVAHTQRLHDESEVISVSTESPIFMKMEGMEKGAEFELNERKYVIEEIV